MPNGKVKDRGTIHKDLPIEHELRCGLNPTRTCTSVYANYRSYKDPLAEDFHGRCGYCDISHHYYYGKKSFHIDHFAPKEKFPAEINKYSNLIYSCPSCNLNKSDDWPSEDPKISIVGNIGYINPCNPEYTEHFKRDRYGKIIAKSEVAKYMHDKLCFYLLQHSIAWNIDELSEIIKALRLRVDNPQAYKLNSKDVTELKDHIIRLSGYKDDYIDLLHFVRDTE